MIQKQTAMRSTSCEYVNKNENIPITVDDSWVGMAILPNGNTGPAMGGFIPKYQDNIEFECNNGKIIPIGDFNLDGDLLQHTSDWVYNKEEYDLKNDFLPTIADCFIECNARHEREHEKDFMNFFESKICKLLNGIKDKEIDCKCPEDIDKIKKKYNEKIKEFTNKWINYYKTTSEKNAFAKSGPCDKNCYANHKK